MFIYPFFLFSCYKFSLIFAIFMNSRIIFVHFGTGMNSQYVGNIFTERLHLGIRPSYYEYPTLHIGVWRGRPFGTWTDMVILILQKVLTVGGLPCIKQGFGGIRIDFNTIYSTNIEEAV